MKEIWTSGRPLARLALCLIAVPMLSIAAGIHFIVGEWEPVPRVWAMIVFYLHPLTWLSWMGWVIDFRNEWRRLFHN